MNWIMLMDSEKKRPEKFDSSRVLVESNAGMQHLSALNSLWRIYRLEDKARE
jgi:hypothetical protein